MFLETKIRALSFNEFLSVNFLEKQLSSMIRCFYICPKEHYFAVLWSAKVMALEKKETKNLRLVEPIQVHEDLQVMKHQTKCL